MGEPEKEVVAIDTRLERLRAPFPAEDVELLPKQVRKDDTEKGKCCQASVKFSADGVFCGGIHARSVHLSYVGHAGITMRLQEVDPSWNWAPLALTDKGTPLFCDGGMWIKLTVLGVTRLGFGDAQGKTGPNAVKETIGDALRNAAMRFGVGTYLWSKSDRAKALKAYEGGEDDDKPTNGKTHVISDRSMPPSSPAAGAANPGDPPEPQRNMAQVRPPNAQELKKLLGMIESAAQLHGVEQEVVVSLVETSLQHYPSAAGVKPDSVGKLQRGDLENFVWRITKAIRELVPPAAEE